MKAIEKRKGPPKKGDDIMLSVINDGRHAAIDMRLAGGDKPSDPSKLDLLVDNVFRVWKRPSARNSTGRGRRLRGQAVRCRPGHADGVRQSRPVRRARLLGAGLHPRRAGAPRRAEERDRLHLRLQVHVAKQKLFNDMNEGKVRILIGSTAKMATGVNAAPALAIHNLDPLWYPADDEQRNGRGIRQGNMNPESRSTTTRPRAPTTPPCGA
jgi:hypothetical protein